MPIRRPGGTSTGDKGPKRAPPPSPEDVFRAMNLASKKLPHYFDKAFGIPDLRLTEFGVLQQLSESGPTSMVRLSDENLVTKAAITAIIDEMEAKGLVRRARDSPDRRVVNIRMTPAGQEAVCCGEAATQGDHHCLRLSAGACRDPDSCPKFREAV